MWTSVLELYVRDLDLGELLPVAGVAPVPGAAREAIDPDLFALGMPHHFGRHLGALENRLAGVHVLPVTREQHLIERHLAPGLGREQRDLDRDAGLGLELAAAGRKNGVRHRARNLNRYKGLVNGAEGRGKARNRQAFRGLPRPAPPL